MARTTMQARTAQAQRARQQVDLPRLLETEESRAFVRAKRLAAAGYPERAADLFDATREAFFAREAIVEARDQPAQTGLEAAIALGQHALQRLAKAV
jgi:hypothetical protein